MTITTHSPIYQKAFEHYLRKGIAIEVSLKRLEAKAHETPFYIWRTAGDDKVRPSHAANEGKIFAWANPPDTGNPGEAINCRCTAEPYHPKVSEFANQTLVSIAQDADYKWRAKDFVNHARNDGGDVTLQQIGQLRDVVNHYAYVVEGGIFKRVNNQIMQKAVQIQNGAFNESFENHYDFRPVSYPHGESTVGGLFQGQAVTKEGIVKVEGLIDYYFRDVFTDPVDLRERVNGTSNPNRVSEMWREVTDGGGKVYKITGQWQTEFHGQAHAKENDSGQ